MVLRDDSKLVMCVGFGLSASKAINVNSSKLDVSRLASLFRMFPVFLCKLVFQESIREVRDDWI